MNESERMHSRLFTHCRHNRYVKAENLLKNCPVLIDIFDGDNLLLHIAIGKNYTETVKILIEYYEEHYLQDDPESDNYLHKKEILIENLKDAIEWAGESNISPEMRAILGAYVSFDEKIENDKSSQSLDDERLSLSDNEQQVDSYI